MRPDRSQRAETRSRRSRVARAIAGSSNSDFRRRRTARANQLISPISPKKGNELFLPLLRAYRSQSNNIVVFIRRIDRRCRGREEGTYCRSSFAVWLLVQVVTIPDRRACTPAKSRKRQTSQRASERAKGIQRNATQRSAGEGEGGRPPQKLDRSFSGVCRCGSAVDAQYLYSAAAMLCHTMLCYLHAVPVCVVGRIKENNTETAPTSVGLPSARSAGFVCLPSYARTHARTLRVPRMSKPRICRCRCRKGRTADALLPSVCRKP